MTKNVATNQPSTDLAELVGALPSFLMPGTEKSEGVDRLSQAGCENRVMSPVFANAYFAKNAFTSSANASGASSMMKCADLGTRLTVAPLTGA